MNPPKSLLLISALVLSVFAPLATVCGDDQRPNVLWIYVDDMSDWMGCYGDRLATTPHIDDLAVGGVKFERAFVPTPVCSTTRSALITGTMPTTHGLHQHRTMIKKLLPQGIVTVPELFRRAGYLTFNEAKYPAQSRVSADAVHVPPQYPDHPVFRNAIARHYEQIAETDAQVGAITTALKEYGLWENTAVFFFTDHGSPLPRAKQFLYDDGTKIPLIVHWPYGTKHLQRRVASRTDLVNGIDISASTLGLAGITVPAFMEGRDLFADNDQPPEFVISTRDRMGNAIDRIRTVRSANFRYIRNDKLDRALYQPQYRDGYATFKTLRELLNAGLLSSLQASYHSADNRPEEELYGVTTDPHQTQNLAGDPDHAEVLRKHRAHLQQWQDATDDKGRYPESQASLKLVFESAAGKCVNPEYDFLNSEKRDNDGRWVGELWTVGQPKSVSDLTFDDGRLTFQRQLRLGQPDYAGGPPTGPRVPCQFVAAVDADQMRIEQLPVSTNATVVAHKYQGKRLPPLPPAPNLASVRFAEPVSLFNAVDLTGWTLTNPQQKNG